MRRRRNFFLSGSWNDNFQLRISLTHLARLPMRANRTRSTGEVMVGWFLGRCLRAARCLSVQFSIKILLLTRALSLKSLAILIGFIYIGPKNWIEVRIMKLAFSTLGCPDWSVEKIIFKARDYGFTGIEIRGIGEHLDVTMLPQFTSQSQETIRWLEDAGVAIVCFSSSVLLSPADPSQERAQLDELKRYAELCGRFQARFIRIFGGKLGRRTWEQAIEEAANYLEKMIAALGNPFIKILIETHDDWLHSHHFRQLLEKVPEAQVGLLWDVNHPYMFIGEAPETTWQSVGRWVEHTHWKDSRRIAISPARLEPCLMGEGEVPHERIYRLLKNGGYNGYFSLEWEKRWHPELAPAEQALPRFVDFMTRLERGRQNG